MVMSASIHWLVVWLFFASLRGILLKPLPQGTVTQSGEPSHFQVDDKAAEIEVNANPAGVKVNAKPASLQVVAKPGTPAIPVYHPAIHVAPHYLPPPVIHREPAMFYKYHHHCHPCCSPMCFGRSRGWFYAGLRRNALPKPSKITHSKDNVGVERSWIPMPSDRDTLGRELDENGHVIARSHKSSIPRPDQGHKHKKSHKRQYISGIPQTQGISSLGTSGYTVQPLSPMLNTRAPLARSNLPYGENSISSYNALSNIGLGTLNHAGQSSSRNVGMYNDYGPIQSSFRSLSSDPSDYVLGTPSGSIKNNFLNNFLQSEFNHELYGSSATPSPLRVEQGYSRSMLRGPLVQQPTGYGALLSGNSFGAMGYQPSVLGAYGNSAQGGLVSGYHSSPIMQLARAYTSQPLPSMIPGLQQYSQTRSLMPQLSALQQYGQTRSVMPQLLQQYSPQTSVTPQLFQQYTQQRSVMPVLLQQYSQSRSIMPQILQQYGQPRTVIPQLSYPYITGTNAMAARSHVPGSKLPAHQKAAGQKNAKIVTITPKKASDVKKVNSKTTQMKGADGKNDKKTRRKRQILDSGLDLDAIQNALVNEFKREMILGNPQAQEPPPIAALASTQPSLGLQLPGIQPVVDQTGQSDNLMQLEDLGANYVAPVQKYNVGNPLIRSQALTTMALGRSQVSPDQMVMVPQQVQTISRLPMEAQAPMVSQPQIQQRFFQNKPSGFVQNRAQNGNEYVGLPMKLNEEYRSPIQYDEQRPRNFRRGRNPLFRRRLHHRYYDDDNDGDEDYYDHDERPLYHERLGRGRITIGGDYSENELPNNDGETLLDTNNHGFGPITVEAKTAEGLKKSIGEDKRGAILKPQTVGNDSSDSKKKKSYVPFRFGVL